MYLSFLKNFHRTNQTRPWTMNRTSLCGQWQIACFILKKDRLLVEYFSQLPHLPIDYGEHCTRAPSIYFSFPLPSSLPFSLPSGGGCSGGGGQAPTEDPNNKRRPERSTAVSDGGARRWRASTVRRKRSTSGSIWPEIPKKKFEQLRAGARPIH